MKKIISPVFIIFFLCTFFLNCNRIKKTDAEIEREQWISGFSDSISFYKERSEKIQQTLEEVNSKINSQLEDFEKINNPREVSGYYLLKGWEKKLPFTTTAIYARINENENLELIATLAGSTFNQIAVGPEDDKYFSEIVPNDQAFNFRHQRFNRVYFTGGKADTIAEYIAKHHSDKIQLEYIENNRKKNFNIPEDERNMIYQTWNLYKDRKESRNLQKELWICSKKIETFRRMMDSENKLEN